MIAIGTFLRAKRVHHLYLYRIHIGPEVWRIAGAVRRGNVKSAAAGRPRPTGRSRSPARPVEGVDQAIGVRDEPVVLLRQPAAPPGEGVVLRDEVRAPGIDLTPEVSELGVEAADLRVHGLEPRAGAVEPGLQRLALAPGPGLVLGVELRLRALDVRLLGPPLGVDRLLEVRAGHGRPRRLQARLHRVRAL